MMKKMSEGLIAILLAGCVALLSGCSGQERYTFVVFDGNGCAFFVERIVSRDDAGPGPGMSGLKPISKDWWNGDAQYSGTIQRLFHDDQPTCKLPKE